MKNTFGSSVAVTLIDAFVHPNYFLKIPIKIVFFLALPLLFFVKNREAFKEFLALFKLRRKGLLKALLLGIGVYAVILGGFFVARNFFDFSRIADSLTNDMGITAENVAERYSISREEQDAFAIKSQQKAIVAQDAGKFFEEIVRLVVEIPFFL